MKITDPDVIKNGEKDLIEALKDDLDLDAVKEILKQKVAAAVLASKGGEIVVHNNDVAFRLDFGIHLNGSLLFDRQGNYIPESDKTIDQESPVFEDSDFGDININDTLEEEEPRTLLSDDEGDDTSGQEQSISETLEEDLKLDLPDDELDQASEDGEIVLDDIIQDDIADDDINDLLQESREFWELKKDS